jgi:type I restriction enzyme S subunit
MDDLQLICDTYMEDLIKTEESKLLGEYIHQADKRNNDLKIDNLLGISVNKIFIPTKSKKERLNLSNYKIVRPRQFGYVSVTSRNGEKISVAILDAEAGLISQTIKGGLLKKVWVILKIFSFVSSLILQPPLFPFLPQHHSSKQGKAV